MVDVVFGAAVDFDGFLNTDGLLGGGVDARRFDGGLVDANGLLDEVRSVVVVVTMAVDNSLVDTDSLLQDRALVVMMVAVDNSLVDADSLLEDRALVVMVVAVDNSLGHTNVFTVAWLVSSTIFTLDLVDGAVVLLRQRLVVAVVMVVIPVKVEFNVRIGVRGTGRSIHGKSTTRSAIKAHLTRLVSSVRDGKAELHQEDQ